MVSDATDTLVYLVYGGGPHADEATYSILSALHHLGRRGKRRIVVYTDEPQRFADLPVLVEHVAEEVLKEWAGPLAFCHRRKILVMKDALERFGGRVLFCDTDTWFRAHPKKAFARIRPGRALMHIAEYRLGDPRARPLSESLAGHAFRDTRGRRWAIGAATIMFNSGVIGLHAADAAVLDEVLVLTDQIYYFAPMIIIEQLAFSICLHEFTRLQQCYDVISHYWKPALRTAFQAQLARVLHADLLRTWEAVRRELSSSAPRVRAYPFHLGVPSLARRATSRVTAIAHRVLLS